MERSPRRRFSLGSRGQESEMGQHLRERTGLRSGHKGAGQAGFQAKGNVRELVRPSTASGPFINMTTKETNTH